MGNSSSSKKKKVPLSEPSTSTVNGKSGKQEMNAPPPELADEDLSRDSWQPSETTVRNSNGETTEATAAEATKVKSVQDFDASIKEGTAAELTASNENSMYKPSISVKSSATETTKEDPLFSPQWLIAMVQRHDLVDDVSLKILQDNEYDIYLIKRYGEDALAELGVTEESRKNLLKLAASLY